MTNIVALDPADGLDGRRRVDAQSPSYEPAASPASGLRPHAEWRPLASLADVTQAWKALAARALEPNIFYEPAFALAAAPAFGRDIGAVLVWSDTEPNRLVGFFPMRVERRRYGIPLPVLVGWTHPYAPFGAPLVDRDCAEGAIEAALDFVAGDA